MAMELNEQMVAELVRQVLKGVNGAAQAAPVAQESKDGKKLTAGDYPLATNRPDLLVGPRGKKFEELTLENVMSGAVAFEDFRITPQALEYQAQVAEAAGTPHVARNLRRAAEMTRIPDERVLAMYNALRPHRSDKAELLSLAEELEKQYEAKICAGFVREAADVYERRHLLKGDLPEA